MPSPESTPRRSLLKSGATWPPSMPMPSSTAPLPSSSARTTVATTAQFDPPANPTRVVRLGAAEYVVIMPGLAGPASKDLRVGAGSLAGYGSELLAAVDYLFFGV